MTARVVFATFVACAVIVAVFAAWGYVENGVAGVRVAMAACFYLAFPVLGFLILLCPFWLIYMLIMATDQDLSRPSRQRQRDQAQLQSPEPGHAEPGVGADSR
jgi:hypothetical protein